MAWYRLLPHTRPILLQFRKIVAFTQLVHMKVFPLPRGLGTRLNCIMDVLTN